MAIEHFDAFLTVDQSLEFQQNLQACGVGVVVAFARTNPVQELRPLCQIFSTRELSRHACGIAATP